MKIFDLWVPKNYVTLCDLGVFAAEPVPAQNAYIGPSRWRMRPARRAAQQSRVSQLAGDQTAVPGQQGSWRDQPSAHAARLAAAGPAPPGSHGRPRPAWAKPPGGGSTITSCRSTRISASLDACLRPSRNSEPDTRTMIKYSRRTDTNRDLAPTHRQRRIAAHQPASSSEAVQGIKTAGGAGGARTHDRRIMRGMLCRLRGASCTDITGHRTDSTRGTGIFGRPGPRTGPRPKTPPTRGLRGYTTTRATRLFAALPVGASQFRLPQLRRPAAIGTTVEGLPAPLEASAPHGVRGHELRAYIRIQP